MTGVLADCALSAWLGLAAAVVTALGGAVGAVLHRQGVELAKIRGLLNGTRQHALLEIETLYRDRLAKGQPLRRSTDHILEHQESP